MLGDGLSFPVNPDAGGESAGYDWAHISAPDRGFNEHQGLLEGEAAGQRLQAESLRVGGSGTSSTYMWTEAGEERQRSSSSRSGMGEMV